MSDTGKVLLGLIIIAIVCAIAWYAWSLNVALEDMQP